RDLTPSIPYWFRVCAYNAAGDSGYSNEATDTMLAQYAPTEFEKWIRKPGIKLDALCEMNLGKPFEGFPFMKDDDLIGCWPFDEGSGMVAYDKSGNGNDGSLENMEEEDWVDGKLNKALEFDGVNERVNVPTDESLDIGTDFSVVVWIKATADKEGEYPEDLAKFIYKGFHIYRSDGGSIGFGYNDD
ncbi:unnamed protein product, partial [marine sediment metagenome]